MKSTLFKFLIIACLSSALAACSTEISGGSGDGGGNPWAKEKFMDERDTIPGPQWSGHWASNCYKLGEAKFRRWDFNVADTTIVRTQTLFNDAACTQVLKEDRLSGRYRFVAVFKDGGWNIEYAFDAGGGFTSYPQEKIKVESDRIYISNFFLAEEGMLLTSEPLFKKNAN